MGVAGCGKSVVGTALAERAGLAASIEGDRLHPPENVARMASGAAAHRRASLGLARRDRRRDRGCRRERAGRGRRLLGAEARAIATGCAASAGLVFIYLEIDQATAAQRVAARKGHFMPASLVDSQFADLQPPGSDEQAIALDARQPVETLVAEAAAGLAAPLASIIRR